MNSINFTCSALRFLTLMYNTEFGLLFRYQYLNIIQDECFCSGTRVNSVLKCHRIIAYISIGISVGRGCQLRRVQKLFRVALIDNDNFKASPQYLKSFQTCLPQKKLKLNFEKRSSIFIFFEMPNYFPISILKLHILNNLWYTDYYNMNFISYQYEEYKKHTLLIYCYYLLSTFVF